MQKEWNLTSDSRSLSAGREKIWLLVKLAQMSWVACSRDWQRDFPGEQVAKTPCSPMQRARVSIPNQVMRSCMRQLRQISRAATKTQHSQINKNKHFLQKRLADEEGSLKPKRGRSLPCVHLTWCPGPLHSLYFTLSPLHQPLGSSAWGQRSGRGQWGQGVFGCQWLEALGILLFQLKLSLQQPFPGQPPKLKIGQRLCGEGRKG